MKKKWIAVGMLAVIVMIGAASNVTEARAKSCQIEGCTQTGEHEHYNCGVADCTEQGEHERYNCEVIGCTKINEHSHKKENHHSSAHKNGHH